jgi:acyl carrier protein
MAPGEKMSGPGWGGVASVVRKNMDISNQLRQFIRTTFLRGDTPELSDTAPLISSGLMDSTDVLELLLYIEGEFGITVGDDESGPERLDTIERISAFIVAKRAEEGVREERPDESEPLAR